MIEEQKLYFTEYVLLLGIIVLAFTIGFRWGAERDILRYQYRPYCEEKSLAGRTYKRCLQAMEAR